MNGLPHKARAYLLAVIGAGLVLLVIAARQPAMDVGRLIQLLVVATAASVAQIIKVEGPTMKTSYNLGLVAYGFAFVLLGPWAAILVAVCASLVEWLWHKYPWFIQSFNICALSIDLAGAGLVYRCIAGADEGFSLVSILGLIAAALAFVFLNHLTVGIAVFLSRGDGFAESGVFGRITLAMDATLFGVGIAAALLWRVNPFAAVIALPPLYLLSTALRMPSLQRQAVTDPKTGLFNARYFEQALERELARSNRYDRPLALVMGDIDLLRNINNTYGHLAGDQVLAGVSQILKEHFREYDIVCRFGGEEFAILMPETMVEDASGRVETLRAAIEEARFEVPTSVTPICVTMSFGLAARGPHDTEGSSLVHRADVAVYNAKRDGRNRVRVSPEWENEVSEVPSAQSAAEALIRVPATGGGDSNRAAIADPQLGQPGGPEWRHSRDLQERARRKAESQSSGSRPGGNRTVPVYIAATVLTAIAAAIVTIRLGAAPPDITDWYGFSLFFLVVVLAESLAVDIYVRDTSVSTSAAPFIAGAMLFGPISVVAASLGMALAAMLKHHSAPSRFAFNAACQMLGGLACVWIGALVKAYIPLSDTWSQLALGVTSGGTLFVISTALVSGAISLSTGRSLKRVWIGQFRWLFVYYLGFGALASALVLSFHFAGLPAMLAVTFSLLLLRYAQKQYLDHTVDLVGQLRRNNSELSARSQDIESLNEELLQVLSNVVDLRDPFVLGHSRQVSRYATRIAQEIGLPGPSVELVRRAGLLHDIGKLGISDDILHKSGTLTDAEYETVKAHSELAAAILRDCTSLGPLILFVRHHHERFDGTGYPDGLAGPSIPVESRILAVADAVEAMASDRPYKVGSTAKAIMRELKNNVGTQFDPAVVGAMCRLIEKEGEEFILNTSSEVVSRLDVVPARSGLRWLPASAVDREGEPARV